MDYLALQAEILATAACAPYIHDSAAPKISSVKVLVKDQAIADIINAQRSPVVGKIERAEFAMWAASCGMRSKIEDHASDKTSPLRDAALACRDVILGAAGSIDFSLGPNLQMLQAWVDQQALTEANRGDLLSLASHPAEQVTPSDVSRAVRGPWD